MTAAARAAERLDKLALMHVPTWTRPSSIKGAAMACRELRLCEYHKELGFGSMRKYSKARFGRSWLANGLSYYDMAAENLPYFHRLWKAGVISPRKLSACGRMIGPTTAWFWLPLLIHLRPIELLLVAANERKALRGVAGGAVFVPLWLPRRWWQRHWAPRDNGESGWKIIQAMIAEARGGEEAV